MLVVSYHATHMATRRHRRSGPLRPEEREAGFIACIERADLMRSLGERHLVENPSLRNSRGYFEDPAHPAAFILICFHLACLFETVRAYRALRMPDARIDSLLTPDFEQKLRDFRDYSFHFTSPADERMLAMIGDPGQPVVRAYELHDALSAFADEVAASRLGHEA